MQEDNDPHHTARATEGQTKSSRSLTGCFNNLIWIKFYIFLNMHFTCWLGDRRQKSLKWKSPLKLKLTVCTSNSSFHPLPLYCFKLKVLEYRTKITQICVTVQWIMVLTASYESKWEMKVVWQEVKTPFLVHIYQDQLGFVYNFHPFIISGSFLGF